MNVKLPIREVRAREILDSRGNPTLEAEVVVENSVRSPSELGFLEL